MEAFKFHFHEKQFDDLRRRIQAARLPVMPGADHWELGTDGGYLQELLKRWCDGYDWSEKERELHQYPQFRCEISGTAIHFFHIPSRHKDAPALLLTHGWPDSFLRYMKAVPFLNEYHLVIPSLPGFAFSTLPQKGYMSNAETAEIWHELMTGVLGYKEYAASGGDMGRGVTCYLAARYPQEVRAIHLTDVGLVNGIIGAPDDALPPEELAYKRRANEWLRKEGAYINIHSTKPQTLAYFLSDSPAGMAAWIAEKYHAWSEWPLMQMDDILDGLTLYWMTNTACSSIRAYHANTFTSPPLGKVTVPTAIAAFPYDVLPAPREWTERNYPVMMYAVMPHGGHFTALEQPEMFAKNVARFMDAVF